MDISSLVVVVGAGSLKMFGISKEMFQKIPNKITYLATECFLWGLKNWMNFSIKILLKLMVGLELYIKSHCSKNEEKLHSLLLKKLVDFRQLLQHAQILLFWIFRAMYLYFNRLLTFDFVHQAS